jgi:hypothetical protein
LVTPTSSPPESFERSSRRSTSASTLDEGARTDDEMLGFEAYMHPSIARASPAPVFTPSSPKGRTALGDGGKPTLYATPAGHGSLQPLKRAHGEETFTAETVAKKRPCVRP